MIKSKFDFLTQKLKVPGTSYSLQLGFVGDVWISRVLKADNVIATHEYEKCEVKYPNQNDIVNWVLRAVAVPDLNPHRIMKTIQRLAKEVVAQKQSYDHKREQITKESKEKTEDIAKKQRKIYEEKLNFFNTIKSKIETGATGNEILLEYDNYPRHFAGILRMYDATLKRIGDTKINNYILKERKGSTKFSRLDSMDAYLEVIKVEQKSIQNQLQQLTSVSH
ncbi:MAG: hypothetical protein GF311_10250 [Candidatus Lokiarchaeota archaeon]|nr:hypothetical protein [Candidatus Lokiarchaeota archaeon]